MRLRDIGVIGTGVWQTDVVTNDHFKLEDRRTTQVKDPFHGRRRDDGTLDIAGMSFTPSRHPRTIEALQRAFADPYRGARRRRLLGADEKVSDAEADAARRALDDAGLAPGDVDALLVQSFLSDELQPHNAALVAHKLGITRAPAWKLDSICNSSMSQWCVGGSLIASGAARHVLCVQSVAYSRVTDPGASTSVQDADLATAFVLGPSPGAEAWFAWETNGALHAAIRLGWAAPANARARSYFGASAERLLIRFDLELQPLVLGELAARAEKLCAETMAAAEMGVGDVDVFLSHQPMAWYAALMSDTLGLRDGVAFDTFEEYGNVNAASLVASMHHARKEGRLGRGSRALLFNPAAGYTYAAGGDPMVTARVDHVTAIVGDAERAATAIAKLLGLSPARSFALPGMNIRTLTLGDIELHLNAPTGDGPVRAFHERMGGAAYHHVAIAVADLDAALDEFAAAGFHALGAPVETAPGLREVFLDAADTGGVLLQIVERRDDARAAALDGAAVAALAQQGDSGSARR